MEHILKPQIAIATSNSLEGIGLKSIIEKMMPGAEISLFKDTESLAKEDNGQFYHYFVSSQLLVGNSTYFLDRLSKTIVLVHGEASCHFPKRVHMLDVCKTEQEMIKNIVMLAETSHGRHKPKVVEQAKETTDQLHLTRREIQVLHLVASGMINKEIAEKLEVGIATIITHRKNIVRKLKIKSVSGLTIYAISHGIIKAEEI